MRIYESAGIGKAGETQELSLLPCPVTKYEQNSLSPKSRSVLGTVVMFTNITGSLS